jgi:hypothetical protein
MPPGKYGTVQFRPPFTFNTTVAAGGGADVSDFANFSLKIYRNSYFASFAFLRFAKVCDPNAPTRLSATPQRLLGCLVHTPHLRVTAKPAPVTIAGFSAQQLDVQAVGKLPGRPSCNGDPIPPSVRPLRGAPPSHWAERRRYRPGSALPRLPNLPITGHSLIRHFLHCSEM